MCKIPPNGTTRKVSLFLNFLFDRVFPKLSVILNDKPVFSPITGISVVSERFTRKSLSYFLSIFSTGDAIESAILSPSSVLSVYE